MGKSVQVHVQLTLLVVVLLECMWM